MDGHWSRMPLDVVSLRGQYLLDKAVDKRKASSRSTVKSCATPIQGYAYISMLNERQHVSMHGNQFAIHGAKWQ